MIINKKSIPHAIRISDTEHSIEYWDLTNNVNRHYYISLENQSYYCSNFDVYLLYIQHPNFFKCNNLENTISSQVLNDIRQCKTMLAIELSFDSSYNIVDELYECILEYKLPGSQILLINSSEDLAEYIVKKSIELSVQPFKYEQYCSMEHTIQRSIMSELGVCTGYNELIKPKIKSPLLSNSFPKKFLNLNRLWREHKLALLMLLADKNLLDKGNISFSKMDYWDTYYNRVLEKFTHDSIQEVAKNSYDLIKKLPLVLDTNRFEPYDLTYFKRSIIPYYNQTYFSVVNETLYDGEKYPIATTEKIFKAIFHKHPFIVVGVPNYLARLRERGYKTFDGIIDESYDTESDASIRMLKIVNEIERLCNLTDSELEEYRIKALEIVEYNFEVLVNKKQFIKRML